MIDSLFLETFSIPIIITLGMITNYYTKIKTNKKKIKYIVLLLVTLVFLLLIDRLNYLSSNVRTVFLITILVLLYFLILYSLLVKYNPNFKYIFIFLLLGLLSVLIETSMYNDKNIMLILGFLFLCYAIFKQLDLTIQFLIVIYCLFVTIISPANEITV